MSVMRPLALETVDRHILSFFPDLVRELGGDPDRLLAKAGVDAEAFAAGRAEIGYRQMVDAVARGAADLKCPDFGMRLARRQAGHIRSPLVTLMESCGTLGEALGQASRRSHAHSPAAAIWVRRESDGDILVGHDILLEGLVQRTQAVEQILLIAALSIQEITGGRVRPRQAHFRHAPVSSAKTYRRHFGCAVLFDQPADALVFRDGDLACPTVRPDLAAREAAIARIDGAGLPRPPLHASVRGAVMHGLGAGACSNAEIARMIGLNVRTMHRRLLNEGASFQRIKTEVRRDLALYYLQETDLELNAISARAGFAEQSALSAFCRKWLSASPSQIRARANPVGVRNEQV